MADTQQKKRTPLLTRGVAISALLLMSGTIGGVIVAEAPVAIAISVLMLAAAWGGLLLLAVVRYRDRAIQFKAATRADLIAARQSMLDRVDDTRLKQSRHEYYQERSLERIEGGLRRLNVTVGERHNRVGGDAGGIDILFVTSNGAGLGHITRLLAISDHLPAGRTFEILTLSKAYRQAARPGLTVRYFFPSSEAAGEPAARWNSVFRDYFRDTVLQTRPRIVVFDGTWVYMGGLTDVCRAFGIPLVWVQRGMWKQSVDERSVQRHKAINVADHVIIPGDFAGGERKSNSARILKVTMWGQLCGQGDRIYSRESKRASLLA